VYNSPAPSNGRNCAVWTVNLLPAVLPGCLVHGDPLMPCCIFLPLQNPLPTFVDQQNQPTGIWTATFLCLLHGTVCVCRSDQVHSEIAPADPDQRNYPFWEIVCECGHENCETRHTIYTGGMENPTEITTRILKMNPTIPCGSHNLVWQREKMVLKQIL